MKEIIDDLFLVIQNIIAGTATVSSSMLSETCLEYKVQLSANSPVIMLQYELESDNIELDRLIPILVYEELDEEVEISDDNTKSRRSSYEITFDESKENSHPLGSVKQERSELLPLLNNNEDVKDKQLVVFDSLQEDQIATISETNDSDSPVSDPVMHSHEHSDNSARRELIEVSPDDLDVTKEQANKINWNCEDATSNEDSEGNVNNNEINKHQDITAVKEKNIFCRYCGKLFETINDKQKHDCDKSLATSSRLKKFKPTPFSCADCGKCFTYPSLLFIHQRTHTGERPFLCTICGKSFTKSTNLIMHKRIHTGEKPFTCEYCGKSYNRSHHLVRHQRIHTGEKPFSCEDCGKSFTCLSNLHQHKIIHTGEKPFSCEDCGKSFNHLSSISRHKRIHTGEKPYACEDCGKSFNNSSDLNQHKKIHTGEKPFLCQDCGRSFRTSGILSQHRRIHTGEKPFSCKYCLKSFTQKNNLLKHLRIHANEMS